MLWFSLLALAAPPTGPTCMGPDTMAMDPGRPALSGPVDARVVDGFFRIHATAEGVDAADPGLIDAIEDELRSEHAAIREAPWRDLVVDDGTAGPELDVYVRAIPALGRARPVPAAVEGEGHSCMVEIDPGIWSRGVDHARSVVRHELHHCVQFRYTRDAHPWVYEAWATYEELRPAPAVDGLVGRANGLWVQRLLGFETPVDDIGQIFEYSGFVVAKSIDEQGFAPWTVWEAFARVDHWPSALDSLGEGGAEARILEAKAMLQGACGRRGSLDVGPVRDMAGCTIGAEAPRQRFGLGEVRDLPAWSATTLALPPPEGDGPHALRLDCAVEAGRVGLRVDGPGASEGADPVAPAEARHDQVFASAGAHVDLLLPPGPPDGVVLTVLGVGDFGSDVACAPTWIPMPVPAAEEPGGCTHAPGPGAAVVLGLLALGLRRRRQGRA